MTTIYALIDPRTNGIRYVGRAADHLARYQQHLHSPHSSAIRTWVLMLVEEGLRPTVDVLETCEDADADAVETRWILSLAKSGALLNVAKIGKCDVPRPELPSDEVPVETEAAPSPVSTSFLLKEAAEIWATIKLPDWAVGVAPRRLPPRKEPGECPSSDAHPKDHATPTATATQNPTTSVPSIATSRTAQKRQPAMSSAPDTQPWRKPAPPIRRWKRPPARRISEE